MLDLYLEAWAFQTFGAKPDVAISQQLESYYEALMRPYGVEPSSSTLASGRKNDFVGMCRLTKKLATCCRINDVDLLLLAHDTPNTLQPLRSVTTSIAHELDMRGMSFAISEQGSAAPFIALSLIQKYAKQGKCKKALLLVVDQTTLPYAFNHPDHQTEDCGLALVLNTEKRAGTKLARADNIFVGANHGVAQAVARYLAQHCHDRNYRIIANAELTRFVSSAELGSQIIIADDALMSAGQLSQLCRIVDAGEADDVVLIHLGKDGQLYFLLFDRVANDASVSYKNANVFQKVGS